MHQVYDESFADLAPYVVAVVELSEGPKVVATVMTEDTSLLRAGLPLRLDYLDVSPELTLPVYLPAAS
jgi:uncharacterized OB-fold protein